MIWLLRSIEKDVPDIALVLDPCAASSITYQEFFRASADKSQLFLIRVELANSKTGDTTQLKMSRYRRYPSNLHFASATSEVIFTTHPPKMLPTDR